MNAKDEEGYTALQIASEFYHPDIVKILLEYGADVNAKREDGFTPLLIALEGKGNTDLVKILLANGADVNAKNEDDKTALQIAKEKIHIDIAQLLKDAGAME